MRVADYIADFIYNQGIDTVFMVAGGGQMFLTDGLAIHPRIKVLCNHHEQASAMATVAYAKYHGIGCAYVSTGCGGTNTITGVLHAWQDSTACIFISGQIKRKETIRNSGIALRQFGVQEADIVTLVEHITKYSVMVNEPNEIRYHLEKAVWLAKTGRPGPVWIDIPLDVQSAEINLNNLRKFELELITFPVIDYGMIINSLKGAHRPVVIAGQGIRLAGKQKKFNDFIHKHEIPVVCSRMGIDVMPTTDKLYIGRIGNKGTRPANFSVQNADLLLSIGSRLSVSTTGHQYELFAPKAKIIVVDIDETEHKKNTIKIDRFIHCDIKDFFDNMPNFEYHTPSEWLDRNIIWKQTYPVFDPKNIKAKTGIDLYHFIDTLSKSIGENDIVVTDAGSAVFAPAQGIELYSENQRYITSGAQAEMGFTVPGVIGVCKAAKHRAIGITGDGSFQMNIQELQTIVYNQLPTKIFVWNNNGYLSMRATQGKFFDGRIIGTDSRNGVSFPDLSKIADAYGIYYVLIEKPAELKHKIEIVLSYDGPVVCEVMCDPDQEIIPSISARVLPDGSMVSPPIDDMYPFLDRDEYEANRLV
jgi:acetolactate synthase-1/2/3 large subunit